MLVGLLGVLQDHVVASSAYKILATTQIPALGGIDYVTADSTDRRVYVACGSAVSIFDLDSFKLAATLPNAAGHGVAIDPENHKGLVSGNPAIFFDTNTLRPIKSLAAPGADGYLFDRFTHHFIILSHRAPNLRFIDSRDGSEVGTVDAIGPGGANAAVEQGVTSGDGRLYFDIANQHHVAVVDATNLKVIGHFDLGETGIKPAGLAIDTLHHILFAMCRGGNGIPPTCIILSAVDGKIITTLPLAGGSDGAIFNPATMEAFSSHGNGTLSVIKEKSPTEFVIEETVQTITGAKTCTLDTNANRIIVIAREGSPPHLAPTTTTGLQSSSPVGPANSGMQNSEHPGGAPQTLDVLFIGK